LQEGDLDEVADEVAGGCGGRGTVISLINESNGDFDEVAGATDAIPSSCDGYFAGATFVFKR